MLEHVIGFIQKIYIELPPHGPQPFPGKWLCGDVCFTFRFVSLGMWVKCLTDSPLTWLPDPACWEWPTRLRRIWMRRTGGAPYRRERQGWCTRGDGTIVHGTA